MNQVKKKGRVIIVEGVWGAGKSTLIKSLAKKLKAVVIAEPDHRGRGLTGPKAITRWYLAAHHRNASRALGQARRGRVAVVERSALASAAYSALRLGGDACRSDVEKLRRQIASARKDRIDFSVLYLKPRDLAGTVARMKRTPCLRQFADKKLIIAFDRYLKKAVEDINK